jgi:aspartate/methionine/tyrosine aminotransferase
VFSSRVDWDLGKNRLSRALDEHRLRGLPILDLTESNPTRAGLTAPGHVLGLLGDPGGASYEPSPTGLLVAREAVSRDYARRGVDVPGSHIVLTASSSEAYAFLFKLLCDPGDRILVPEPSYPLFAYLATLESVEVWPYPLRYDGEWHVDLSALETLPPRARAILAVNPNNPTGSFVSREDGEALRAIASSHGLALIVDEVFADYSFREAGAPSLYSRKGPPVFCLGGLSKSCGLPQLKLGWVAVGGAEGDAALSRLEVIGDTYLTVGTPVQRALPEILAQREALQAPIKARLEANLETLDALPEDTPAGLLRPEGGWSAVLRVPATASEEEWALALLEKDGVLVHPGYFFDFPSEAYLVVSLLVREDDFRRGLDRLLERVSS